MSMKKIQYISALLITGIIIFQSLSASADPKASIEFQNSAIDFGEIAFGKPVTVEFLFNNPGMVPLLITKVESSCGCTVADYPRQPIISGGQGKIIITFDAKTEGYFSKTITVYSNTQEGLFLLHIEGVVMK
jgi:hypothetical protein